MNQIKGRNPMSAYHRHHGTADQELGSPVTRLASDPPQHHTHVQQVAGCKHVDIREASGC